MRALLSALCLLTVAACGRDIVTEFPLGLEPIEPNRAPPPPPDATGTRPEALSLISGERRDDDLHWTHARAYVHQPLAKTWAAFQDPEVVVDRRKVDSWRVTPNVEEGFDVSFRVHNTVNYILTVDFDITWRQSAIQGDRTAPEVVAVRFQKTFGTSFIELLSGSVIAREVEGGITEIEVVEHLKSATEKDAAESYIRDLYQSVLERAHGRPLPTYD